MKYNRKYNFSPGPAVLPLEVLEAVRDNLLNYRDTGLGIMELSHRGPEFLEILHATEKSLRALLNISDNYAVLFTTGGATNQFSMIPMNLALSDEQAYYLVTGEWAKKAYQEGQKFCRATLANCLDDYDFSFIPKCFNLEHPAAYVHFTSNNTIYGTQFENEPDAKNHTLVCDASSDFLGRKIDVSKYGVLYAGAQKNLGPAGLTVVVIKKELLERSSKKKTNLPMLMNYNTYAESESLYNTIPVFQVYVVGEVLKWLINLGGLEVVEQLNRKKAKLLYDAIDNSDFYRATARPGSRSMMNATFRLPTAELETKFVKEAEARGFSNLQGHRLVGGLRASIYNAFPIEGIEELVHFMKDFERAN